MTNQSEIYTEIQDFASAFHSLPEISEPPSTTLEILHQQAREKYWNRLLHYFLEPSNPHGFGSDFLSEFLELIEDRDNEFEFSHFELDEMQTEAEAVSERGRPDLLLYCRDNWFVCIEVKVTASETGNQTEDYAKSRVLGDVNVSNYTDDESQYVYLSKQTHTSPASEEFIHLYWDDVQAAMGALLDTAGGQYPIRSTTQLAEFRDTIRNESMSDNTHDTHQNEYAELYIEHTDAIDTVKKSFNEIVDREIEQWATKFENEYWPDDLDGDWICDSDKYGKILKPEWRRDEDGNTVTSWSDAAFRLEFRHRIRDETSWTEGTVTFRTVIPKNADEEYRDRCSSVFTAHINELQTKAEPTQIDIREGSRILTEAVYSFDATNVPEGYYETLTDALDEHMILLPLLTHIFEEAYTRFV